MSDEIYKPTPRRCASVVRRLRRGCHEPLRGAAPRGVVVARQLSPASQGLLELCAFVFLFLCGEAGEERERVCVCKNVDVQEAQREAFPFTVAAYRMRKSPECTRRTHTPPHPPCENYTRGIHASVNRRRATLTILHPVRFSL